MTFDGRAIPGLGFGVGFVFGAGCALAVMHSIWMVGFRAAVKGGATSAPPERLTRELARISRRSSV